MICEKCWNDAYRRAFYDNRSQVDIYLELVEERKGEKSSDSPKYKQCSKKEQRGDRLW